MRIEVHSPTIRRKEMDAVLTAMVEDKIGPGEQAEQLVQTAKDRIKFDYCVALRSPVFALFSALKSLNLEQGQAVALSALSPLYYASVIHDLGLRTIYIDVLPFTTCLDRKTVENAFAARTDNSTPGCILLYNALGFVSDKADLSKIGLPIIEDCSQSYGTRIGEIATASETAVLNTGSGNAVDDGVNNDYVVFTILGLEEKDMLTSGGGALLYSHGRRDAAVLRGLGKFPPEYGLPDMNAALAVVQFREFAKNISKRRELGSLYTQSALRTRHRCFVQPDVAGLAVEYNNYAFPLILETGVKEVKAYARRKEIIVENAFENTLIGSGLVPPEQCPESYSLSLRTVLFPLYPRLGAADAEKIAKIITTLP